MATSPSVISALVAPSRPQKSAPMTKPHAAQCKPVRQLSENGGLDQKLITLWLMAPNKNPITAPATPPKTNVARMKPITVPANERCARSFICESLRFAEPTTLPRKAHIEKNQAGDQSGFTLDCAAGLAASKASVTTL